jgi:hypothetical protein
MPDGESQTLDNNNAPDNGEAAADGNKQQPPASQEGGGTVRIATPEALIMLTLAALLDLTGWALIALDAAFGIGLAFSPAVALTGYAVIGVWQMSRGMGGSGKGGKFLSDNLMRFIKKQGWKMGIEAVPIVGDVMPTFLWIVYSGLKDPN